MAEDLICASPRASCPSKAAAHIHDSGRFQTSRQGTNWTFFGCLGRPSGSKVGSHFLKLRIFMDFLWKIIYSFTVQEALARSGSETYLGVSYHRPKNRPLAPNTHFHREN